MAKGRPRKFNEDTALDTALRLFWTHGYEGTSVAMLAKEIGINVPSLYSAFGNKESLFFKTVEHYGQNNASFYDRALAKETAYEAAREILMEEVRLVTLPDYPDGCLMVQGALVTSPESEGVRALMASMRGQAEGWMRERFERAKEEGDLPESADPASLACYLMTLNSGIAVQAKSGVPQAALYKLVDLALANWPGRPA